ncbi:MAG: tape measure protein [Gammaproteobacteria bacterium]
MADVELRLTADVDQATKEVAGFRKEYADLIKAVEKPLRQIDTLKQTQESAKRASAEYFSAKKRVTELKVAIAAAGQPVKSLDRDLAQAERTLALTTKAFEQQKAKVREQRTELKAAGIDTRNLAAEQQRLNAELGKRVSAGRSDLDIGGAASRLGVTQLRSYSAGLRQARSDYELLRASGKLTARELTVAQQSLNTKVRETTQAMKELAGQQQRSRSGGTAGLGSVAGVAGAAYGSVSALRAYVDITDTAKKMEAQLRLATSSQDEFNQAQEDTFRIAQNAQAPVEDVVATYARLAPALDQIGRKKDAITVVDTLTKALRINGATTAESSSVLTQFSQAMSSGVLRGEEFNSVAEAAPPLLRAFAEGLGVPVGALRAMAAEGLLTAEIITDLSVKALPGLTEAASKLPDTVDGALTRLRNDLLKAFSDGDTSGLIDAVTTLRKVLTDPATVQGLSDLASGMATLAGWTVQAASEFTAFAKELAYAAANSAGYIDDLTKLEKTLAGVKQARDGGSLIGRPTASFFMDQKQLDDWVKELEEKILEYSAKIAGVTVEAYKAAQEATAGNVKAQEEAAAEKERIDEQTYSKYSQFVGDMKGKQDEAVANAETSLKAMVSAEKKAAKDLETAKKAQLDTQKRYSDALAKLGAGAAGDPSYAQAQSLRLAATNSLRAGDVEGAKANAQAALKVLADLQAAGENTYGFAGFINSLKAIEDQADQINVDKAKKGFDDAQKKAVDLKALLDSVKETVISVKMSDTALAQVRSQIMELAALAGKPLVIGDQVANPGNKGPGLSSALGQGLNPPPQRQGSPATPPANTSRPAVDVDIRPAGIRQDGQNSFTNLPPVDVDVRPAGIRQDGASSFTNLPAVEVDVLPVGIRKTGENSFTNLPAVGVDLEIDQEAAAIAEQAVDSLSIRFRRQMQIPVVPVVQGDTQAAPPATPGYAAGGMIHGPGTGRSDSILARLSNGEFVMRADAVKHYGASLLEQLNSRQLPRFATGGMVSSRLLPGVPSMAEPLSRAATESPLNGLEDWGRATLGSGRPGEEVEVLIRREPLNELRRLAMKFGR